MLLMQRASLIGGKKRAPAGYLKVSVISDLHIVSDADNDPDYPPIGRRLLYTPLTKLQKFVDYTNALPASKKPHLGLGLGDIVNGDNDLNFDTSFDSFMNIWSQLDIPKDQTCGNHDYSSTIEAIIGKANLHDYVAGKYGDGARPRIANCKMNKAYVIEHPAVNIRFINFDTNQNENGDFVTNGGYLSPEVLDWMKSNILDNQENMVVFYTHRYRPLMTESECLKFETMVQECKNARPGLITYLFYGHSHPQHYQIQQPVIGSMDIYNIPAIVDNLETHSVDFLFDSTGIVSATQLPWSWP